MGTFWSITPFIAIGIVALWAGIRQQRQAQVKVRAAQESARLREEFAERRRTAKPAPPVAGPLEGAIEEGPKATGEKTS